MNIKILVIEEVEKTIPVDTLYLTYEKYDSYIKFVLRYNDAEVDEKTICFDSFIDNTKLCLEQNSDGTFQDIFDEDYSQSGRYKVEALNGRLNDIKLHVNTNNECRRTYINLFKCEDDYIIAVDGILFKDDTEKDYIETIKIESKLNEYLIENYPSYKEKRKTINIRKKLLVKLDPNDSLSYVEAQLDYLSALVFYLIDENKDLKERLNEDWDYTRMKELLESSSILNIKPLDYCEVEFNNKAEFRKHQEVYYDEKY